MSSLTIYSKQSGSSVQYNDIKSWDCHEYATEAKAVFRICHANLWHPFQRNDNDNDNTNKDKKY